MCINCTYTCTLYTYTFRVHQIYIYAPHEYHTTSLYSGCWTYACARVDELCAPAARSWARARSRARSRAARLPCAHLCGAAHATCHGTLLHKSNSIGHASCVRTSANAPRHGPAMSRFEDLERDVVKMMQAEPRVDVLVRACVLVCARALGQPFRGHGSRAAPGSSPDHSIAAGRPAWSRPWQPRSFGLVA